MECYVVFVSVFWGASGEEDGVDTHLGGFDPRHLNH